MPEIRATMCTRNRVRQGNACHVLYLFPVAIEKENAMKKLALLTAVAGFCVALTSGRPALSDSTPAVGEESTTIVVAQAEGKKKKFRGRLPNNYGKVGISDTQRKTIYGIQAGYRKQLVALTQQIAELKSK